MADIIYSEISGVPPNAATRYKDCGDGTYAALGMSVGGPAALQSLSSVSALSTGSVFDNDGVRNNHSLVTVTSAGVNGGIVTLQGSQDNVNWFALVASSALTASAAAIFTANLTPVRYLRASVTTAVTGGTVSAWVASAG